MRSPHVAAPRRAMALRVLAAGCLALGYAGLARGGTTLAPLLLVTAYLGLVPAALLET